MPSRVSTRLTAISAKRFHGPPALSASQLKKAQKETRVRSKSSKRRAAVEEEPYRPPQASHWWFALPIAILSLIVIVPAAMTDVAIARSSGEGLRPPWTSE